MTGENTAELKLNEALNDAVKSLGVEGVNAEFERPKHEGHGDRAANVAMRLAKTLKANPKEIALNTRKNISRACLLNYNIAAAELIKIQSNDLNGRFTVVKGKHIGGRTGDWKTTMELKPYT